MRFDKAILKIITLLFLASYAKVACAQVFISVNPSTDTVNLGDTFSLKVTLSLDNEASASIPDFASVFADSTGFYVVQSTPMDTVKGELGYYVHCSLTLQPLDTGRLVFPIFNIPYEQHGIDTFSLADSAWIFSRYIATQNPEEPAPPEDIIRLEERDSLIWWVLLVILLILGVVAIVYFLKKSRKATKVKPNPTALIPVVCPENVALRQLDEIQHFLGDSATFFGGLNNLVRNYLLQRFGLNTHDKTPEELISTLNRDILIRNKPVIYEMLHGAEYVLYGKGQTLEEYQRALVSKTRHFLEQMKQQWGDCA